MGKLKDITNDVAEGAKMKKGFLQATNYLNSHLNADEVPLYRAHLSWIPVFVHQVPFMILGGIIGGIVWGITGNFLLGCAIQLGAWGVGIVAQLHQIYKNIATDILLTNQGVHSKYKLFAVEDDQFTRYAYVNDAELSYNSVFQRLLEYGDVKISTISGADDDYTFKCVAKPMSLKRAVRAAQNKYNSMNMGGGPAASRGQMGGPGIASMPPNNQMENSNGRNRKGGPRRRGKSQ